MGSDFVQFQQDPWAGNFANTLMKNLSAAPGVALSNAATVESILAAREKRARDTEKWEAGKKAAGLVEGQTPEASVPFSVRDIEVAQQGPVNPADPTTQPGETFLPPLPYQEHYQDPRALALAKGRRAYGVAGAQATLLNDPSQWAPQGAQAEVAAAGLPTDPREQARLQFATTGRVPTAAERTAPTVHNLSVTGADGVVRVVSTVDNRTEFGTGRSLFGGPNAAIQPGERVAGTGPADQTAPNPLKDEAAARERLAVLSRSIGPDGPTPTQATQIAQLVDVAYKPERKVEKIGDQDVVQYVRTTPIPPWVVAMMQPRGKSAAAAVTSPPPDPNNPDDPNAGIPISAGSVPAAVTAPTDPNADRAVEVRPGSAIELRKEYHGLPDVQRYVKTAGTWNSTVQHAYAGNKAADLALVYGFIKMLDDLTGVREGETKLVSGVGSWAEQASTWLGNAKGTGLDPETRIKIVETMQRTMNEIRAAAQAKEKLYTQAAVASKLAPKAVLGELMPMVEFDRERARTVRNVPMNRASATTAPTTTPSTGPTQQQRDELRRKMESGTP